MPTGCLLDKNHPPTEEDIRLALGAAYPLWQRLVSFIEAKYPIPPELNFGGKNYGWNLWYRKSGKTLVTLFPQAGFLVAQVVLGKDQVEAAMALDLGEAVGARLRETPQLHDGKWLFIPVRTEQEAAAVEQLLIVKRKPRK